MCSRPDEESSNVLIKVEEMVESSRMEDLAQHGDLVAERAAHGHVLMDHIRL